MGLKTVTVLSSMTVASIQFEASTPLDGNDDFSTSYSVPAAKTGALTTRTDNDTGTLTMDTGHGITTGARLDLYWDGGCRRGITVGTVAGDSVPIDLGSGDNLPADETSITAMVPTEASFPLTVADAQAIAVKCDANSQFTFCEADETESKTFHVEPAVTGEVTSKFYAVGLGTAPTETTITKVYLSHGDSEAAHTMTAAAMSD